MRLLLENGANINAQGKDHTTALEAAGAKAVVHLLLNGGATVNTMIMEASSDSGNEEVKKSDTKCFEVAVLLRHLPLENSAHAHSFTVVPSVPQSTSMTLYDLE